MGDDLARRIHRQVGISSLEELELAAHDGRLENLEGIGPQRVESIRLTLASKLSRSTQRKLKEIKQGVYQHKPDEPSDALLLEIDKEYRLKAKQDKLKKIAPKRFNPENKAWLPVMKTKREGWQFTALFSNTACAHKQGKTGD